MVRGVCDEDPRTMGERRSDALAAMAVGIHELACRCADADCSATQRDATPPATAVVHVVAHAETVEAVHSIGAVDEPLAAVCPPPAAFVIGGGVLPAPLLPATLERATVREVRHPVIARPSRAIPRRGHWLTSCAAASRPAAPRGATSPPRIAIWTTPFPILLALRMPQTSSACAGFITCSRHSVAGPIDNCPMAR